MSVTVSDAANTAALAGENVRDIEQLAPAASDEPQLLVCAKLEGFAPPMLIAVMLRLAVPLLLNVTT